MTGQVWRYAATVTEHPDGEFVVSFADLPECLTSGDSRAEALINAADALDVAILGRMADGEPIPAPRAAAADEVLVDLDPVSAARAALRQAMAEDRVSNAALARQLGRSEGAVRRLTDGATGVKIDTVLEALRAVGRSAALMSG